MSVFRGKADILLKAGRRPLLTHTGHSWTVSLMRSGRISCSIFFVVVEPSSSAAGRCLRCLAEEVLVLPLALGEQQ